MNRAYCTIEIKAVESADGKRQFSGIATTPSTDRMGDVVNPKGAQFKLPIPLLWQHNSREPIGWVTAARVTDKGIEVDGEVASVQEDGTLKDRLTEAWQMLKAKLVRGLSIGFNALESARIDGTFGIKFIAWEWLELSCVTIPANQDASITAVKSIDKALRAASGHEQSDVDGNAKKPGATGKQVNAAKRGFSLTPKGTDMKTVQEQIAALEAARAAKTARLSEIMQKSMDEGRSTDEAEAEEFDTLELDVKQADADLVRLRLLEKLNVQKAKEVSADNTSTAAKAAETRGGAVIFVKDNLPKGTAFIRYVIAMANGRGSVSDALKFAERWQNSTPQVAEFIKAVAGTTTGAHWALPLAEPQNLAGEFIELLMPGTIIGKIQGLRRVPFNVKISVQTAGSLVNWVGEAAPKPVGELAFDTITLGINKCAGIVVLTDELVRLSTPNAEMLVRDDMVKQVTKFLDAQFIDPTVALSAGVHPASITHGVTPITASGSSADDFRADMRALRAAYTAANLSTAGAVLIMNSISADALSDMVNPLGQPEFPGLTVGGGTLRGMQVIVSENVPSDSDGSIVVMAKPSEILLADDGVTVIDASREATLDMAGGSTPVFSLWQKNCVGIRAERWITWLKARAEAVQYISGANYGEMGS
jgi:HK97 family phage major capsid protein/HK97 family phage prohead protease